MKVLLLNGSPRNNGTTNTALTEMAKVFKKEGIETEIICVGSLGVSGCRACLACKKSGKCIINDEVNSIAEKLNEADGIVLGSPVYYASPNGSLLSFLDRLFFSTSSLDKRDKVGASVVCARRGGLTASFDVLNKYMAISGMPIATSTYWNQVHGSSGEEAMLDLEGMSCLRSLALNMVFLMKSICLGKEKYGLPEKEPKIRTNFIR